MIAANHDTLWRRLAALIGHPELAEDERFASHHARGENEDLLDELIGAWAVQHTAAELDQLVNDAGVVCAPVYDAADVYKDPYFRERELLIEYAGRGPRHDHGSRRGAEADCALPDACARPPAGRSGPIRDGAGRARRR